MTNRETDPKKMGISGLLRAFEQGDMSPLEAMQACIDQRKKLDDDLHAFCQTDDERALASAAKAGSRLRQATHMGPLHGVPLAVKDDLPLAGWPLLNGSNLTKGSKPVNALQQAPTVSSLLRGGCCVIGKTTLPEFGWKATTQSPLTGITRNPWNTALTPGGSSGGNAAAVATGMAPASLGTDIGGSVRIPAAFCGIVGFKPTQTIMSMSSQSKTGLLLHSGPMARTVEDIAYMMKAAGAADPSRPERIPSNHLYLKSLNETVQNLRVAVTPGFGYAKVDPEIETMVRNAADVFTSIGASVGIDEPVIDSPVEVYQTLLLPHFSLWVDEIDEDKRDQLDPGLIAMAEEGRRISALDFAKALKARRRFIHRMGELHNMYDVVVTATVPVLPFAAEDSAPEGFPPHRWWEWTPLTILYNLTGQPAISLPCGRSKAGLPIGMQIAGPHNRDDLVLTAAHAFQRAAYWPEWPDMAT